MAQSSFKVFTPQEFKQYSVTPAGKKPHAGGRTSSPRPPPALAQDLRRDGPTPQMGSSLLEDGGLSASLQAELLALQPNLGDDTLSFFNAPSVESQARGTTEPACPSTASTAVAVAEGPSTGLDHASGEAASPHPGSPAPSEFATRETAPLSPTSGIHPPTPPATSPEGHPLRRSPSTCPEGGARQILRDRRSRGPRPSSRQGPAQTHRRRRDGGRASTRGRQRPSRVHRAAKTAGCSSAPLEFRLHVVAHPTLERNVLDLVATAASESPGRAGQLASLLASLHGARLVNAAVPRTLGDRVVWISQAKRPADATNGAPPPGNLGDSGDGDGTDDTCSVDEDESSDDGGSVDEEWGLSGRRPRADGGGSGRARGPARGNWTRDEDEKILRARGQGKSWAVIQQEELPGRTRTQISSHYHNVLRG